MCCGAPSLFASRPILHGPTSASKCPLHTRTPRPPCAPSLPAAGAPAAGGAGAGGAGVGAPRRCRLLPVPAQRQLAGGAWPGLFFSRTPCCEAPDRSGGLCGVDEMSARIVIKHAWCCAPPSQRSPWCCCRAGSKPGQAAAAVSGGQQKGARSTQPALCGAHG